MTHQTNPRSSLRLLRSAVALLLLLQRPVFAAELNNMDLSATLSDKIYYQIGGANVSTRSSSRMNTFGYGISTQWQGLQMCGNLNLENTVNNQLNGVTEGFKAMMSGVIQQATGAVMSLPGLILKRSNPDVYDLIQGGILQARVDFDRGLLSCQRMVELADEALGSGGWQQAATSNSWEEAIEENHGDAAAVQQQVNRQAGNKGLTWVDGQAGGGHGQPSIAVTRDTMVAGYNILNGRSQAGNTSSLPSSACTGELCRHWPAPEDAAKFMTRIVGEQEIRTCDGCEKSKTTAGVGLMPIIQEEQDKIYEALQNLVAGRVPPTPENLAKASGGSMRTSRNLVEALQKDPDQEVLTQRLSAEMALIRVLELAISASRALFAGMKEPNIANVKEAVATNDRSLDMLEREIGMIKTELELRTAIASNTATAILERMSGRQAMSEEIDQSDPEVNRPALVDKSRAAE